MVGTRSARARLSCVFRALRKLQVAMASPPVLRLDTGKRPAVMRRSSSLPAPVKLPDVTAELQDGPALRARFAELEKSPIFRWLLQFGGFKERLLADDLFLAKVAMECGVGVFTKVLSFFLL